LALWLQRDRNKHFIKTSLWSMFALAMNVESALKYF
jgi:hypothetical protein